jgi:hypothetical protein
LKAIRAGGDNKDFLEGGGFGGFGFLSTGVVTPTEPQPNPAMMGEQLTHFISQQMRPDLGPNALKEEPDLNHTELAALSRRLQQLTSDAKQAKDSKDIEKLHERTG